MKPLLKAERLRPGDLVGLIAPASPLLDLRDIHLAVRALIGLGFRVKQGESIRRRYGFLAGTDRERADDLHAMFADPEVRGIFPLRGGYGSGRLLPLLDWALIEANPKVIVGHSDLTALLTAIHARTGLVTFWGPLAGYDLGRHSTPFKLKWLKRVVCEARDELVLPYGLDSGKSRRWRAIADSGPVTGPLIGGNLSLLASLMGTPYETDTRGCLLFLEDVDEEPYKMDRMLGQLALAGKLSGAAGLVVGKCVNCESSGRMKRTFRLREVLDHRLGGLGLSVIYGVPLGHETDKITLPLGVRAGLDPTGLNLALLEPAVL